MTQQHHRTPFLVTCLNCGAQSIVAYTPMPMGTFAEILGRFRCPWCASAADRMTPSPASAPTPPAPEPMSTWPDWMKPKEPR